MANPKIRAAAIAFAQQAARQQSQFARVSYYPHSLDTLAPLHRAGEQLAAEFERMVRLEPGQILSLAPPQ